MASLIPNKIHFMWEDEGLPHFQRHNFAKWVVENPKYSIMLWVKRQQGEKLANELAKEVERRSAVLLKDDEKEIHVVSEFDRWRVAVRGDDITRPFRMFTVRSLDTVEPLSDDFTYQTELAKLSEEGVVTDLMRLWVLYQEGGIYLDLESETIEVPLPVDIKAPKDLLLGVLMKGMPYFTDTALACPEKSKKILSILHYMDGNYTKELETRSPFLTEKDAKEFEGKRQEERKIRSDAVMLAKHKEELRKEVLEPEVPEEWVLKTKQREEDAERQKHKMELLDAGIDFVEVEKKQVGVEADYEHRTWRVVNLTGQQMITEWLRKYEGINPQDADMYDFIKQADYPLKLKETEHFESFLME